MRGAPGARTARGARAAQGARAVRGRRDGDGDGADGVHGVDAWCCCG